MHARLGATACSASSARGISVKNGGLRDILRKILHGCCGRQISWYPDCRKDLEENWGELCRTDDGKKDELWCESDAACLCGLGLER